MRLSPFNHHYPVSEQCKAYYLSALVNGVTDKTTTGSKQGSYLLLAATIWSTVILVGGSNY